MIHQGPFFVVFNGGSGSGDAALAQQTLRDIFTEAGREHELLIATDPRQLPAQAQRAVSLARAQHGAVVAAGGDGTANAVAQALLGENLPFGLIPRGTFNYFARAHGLPLPLEDATRALLTATAIPVQVGLVNDRVFLVNASIGFYPRLLEEREAYKRRFGRNRFVALGAALATLLRPQRSITVQLEYEGKIEVVDASTLFVGNNPLQLEQFGVNTTNRIDEGLLTAIMVRRTQPWAMLGLLLRGALGKWDGSEKILSFAFSRLTLRPPRHYPRRARKVAMDGEVTRMKPPLEFRVAPQPLYLLAPSRENGAP